MIKVVYNPFHNDQILNDIAIVDVDVDDDDDVVVVVVDDIVVIDDVIADDDVVVVVNEDVDKDVVHLNFNLQEICYIIILFYYNNKLNCKIQV